jgi:hypothetical protein
MARGGVCLDVGTRDAQERSQDAMAHRGDPGQAAGPGPAEQMEQNSLSLVVHGVGDGNAGGPHPRRHGI